VRRISGDEKHAPSSYSTLDVLWVLYDRILTTDPKNPDRPDRDRFLLSKGHGPAAYYAVLAQKGFFPEEWLDDMGGWNSPLGNHPDRLSVPGVEIGRGSVGHGLGIGVGMALGLRAQGYVEPRVFVLLGDAELDEGSSHEAIAYAAATHGWPGGIAARFPGWIASVINGRDQEQVEHALARRHPDRPNVVVATVEPKRG
jgi:transketolase